MLYDIRTVYPISKSEIPSVVISFWKEFWGKNSVAQGRKNPAKHVNKRTSDGVFVWVVFLFFGWGRFTFTHCWPTWLSFWRGFDGFNNFRWLVTLWFPKVLFFLGIFEKNISSHPVLPFEAFLKAMATNHGTEETLAATVFVARNVWNPSSHFWMNKNTSTTRNPSTRCTKKHWKVSSISKPSATIMEI